MEIVLFPTSLEAEVDWRDDRWKPSRQEYEEFGKDMAKGPSAAETGLMIFLTMLFIMPATALVLAAVTGLLGEYYRHIALIAMLLGGCGLAMLQAYRGIVRRRVRVVPKSRIKSEAAYVGGRINEVATGNAAVRAGVVFFIVGAVAMAIALLELVELLRLTTGNG